MFACEVAEAARDKFMATTTTSAKRSRKSSASLSSGPGGPWSQAAPRRIRHTYQGDENSHGWTLWRKHLAKRKLRPLGKLFGGSQPAIFWALPADTTVEPAERVFELVRRPRSTERRTAGLENAVQCWFSQIEVAAADTAFALECIAWAQALPQLAEHVTERCWWQLVNRLVAIASAQRCADNLLALNMLHAELPVVLAYVLPEVAECQSLVATAHRMLERASEEPLEENQPVDGQRLELLRPLLACWTRIRAIGHALDDAPWSDDALREYARLVEYALRLSRPDGRQVLESEGAPTWNRRLLKTALRLADHAKTQRVGELLKTGGKPPQKNRQRMPRPSFKHEPGGIAVLRSSWRRTSPQLAINHAALPLASELTVGKECLWSGQHEVEVRIDGHLLTARHPWDQICWESDDDIDYVELELKLSDGVTIQRHMALARGDRFLLLADAVLGERAAKIEYRGTLPLGSRAAFQGEPETREGTIVTTGGLAARVLPLALGEWRSGPNFGDLQSAGDALELTQSADGVRLFAPLFIDLDPRRMAKEVTWRQLTVGENRSAVRPDEAVGYRVQIGRAQWLIYRSLAKAAVRTVLGKNLLNELLIGRFDTGGSVQTLLEIEA